MRSSPGLWLDRFADSAFPAAACKRVFRPIIADMQLEYFDALARKRPRDAERILLRGRFSFLLGVVGYLATQLYHVFDRENPMDRGMPVAHRPLTLTLALGALGAVVVVGSAMFFAPGKYILLPYAFVVVGTGVVLRSTRVVSYRDRFMIGLGAFMIATVAHYLWLTLIDIPRVEHHYAPISLFGHAWRLGFMLLLGAAFNAALAVVSAVPDADRIPVLTGS